MIVITPPTQVDSLQGPYIFLAGSIEMGNAIVWQTEISKRLSGMIGTILNPRRPDWDPTWEQSISNPHFCRQVNWELDGLHRADVIPLYYAPGTKSPISLMENGLYATSKKLIIYCPPGFWRKGNVDVVADRYHIPVFEDYDRWATAITTRIRELQ